MYTHPKIYIRVFTAGLIRKPQNRNYSHSGQQMNTRQIVLGPYNGMLTTQLNQLLIHSTDIYSHIDILITSILIKQGETDYILCILLYHITVILTNGLIRNLESRLAPAGDPPVLTL